MEIIYENLFTFAQEQLSNAIADQQTKQELQEQLQFNNLEAVVEISDNLTHEFVTYDEQECELEVHFCNTNVKLNIYNILFL